MRNPVQVVASGVTYDAKSFAFWQTFGNKNIDPKNGRPIASGDSYPLVRFVSIYYIVYDDISFH